MAKICCPNCHTEFELESQAYLDIVSQVRGQEFERELQERERLAAQGFESRLKEVELASKQELQEALAQKEQELASLRLANEKAQSQLKLKQEEELRLRFSEMEQLKNETDAKVAALEQALALLKQEHKASQQSFEQEKQSAVLQATHGLEQKLAQVKSELQLKAVDIQAKEANFEASLAKEREQNERIVRLKDEEIERLKDFKLRQTVKLTGESLEQHCNNEFLKWRSSNPQALSGVTFEKDNEAVEGTKGDFIYREYDELGNELLSIMFEMKNEELSSTNKKTNESHLDKLDKDRKKKGCEYAVLVSMLELDNEFYNQGIVDMSWRCPKTYVIRPQFFITLISLLRSAAHKSQELKAQIRQMANEQIDITNFEAALSDFQAKSNTNYERAAKKFGDAIAEIDKSIAALQKVKDNLLGSENNLRLANNKAQDLSIKKLTKNSPLLAERFKALKQ